MKGMIIILGAVIVIVAGFLFQAYFIIGGLPTYALREEEYKILYSNCEEKNFVGQSLRDLKIKFYEWPKDCACAEKIVFLKINSSGCDEK